MEADAGAAAGAVKKPHKPNGFGRPKTSRHVCGTAQTNGSGKTFDMNPLALPFDGFVQFYVGALVFLVFFGAFTRWLGARGERASAAAMDSLNSLQLAYLRAGESAALSAAALGLLANGQLRTDSGDELHRARGHESTYRPAAANAKDALPLEAEMLELVGEGPIDLWSLRDRLIRPLSDLRASLPADGYPGRTRKIQLGQQIGAIPLIPLGGLALVRCVQESGLLTPAGLSLDSITMVLGIGCIIATVVAYIVSFRERSPVDQKLVSLRMKSVTELRKLRSNADTLKPQEMVYAFAISGELPQSERFARYRHICKGFLELDIDALQQRQFFRSDDDHDDDDDWEDGFEIS